jgi:hypothetical protein
MVAIVLADAMLDKFGGDSVAEIRDNLQRYQARIGQAPEAPVAGGRLAGAGTVAIATRTADEVGSGGDD